MAAPTNVRVESNSITTTTLRWTYSGSGQISVHRSTDGSAYTEATSAGNRVAPGTTSYDDTGLSVGTKYWYKLSDDAGSTFSSVVTVHTHSCAGPISTNDSDVALPRFETSEVDQIFSDTDEIPGFLNLASQENIDRMNEMAERIEAAFRGQEVAPDKCIACPEDGAVVIDCSNGCNNWSVVADTDINSVSINWCDQFDGTIDLVVPPNTTVGVCGFPAGFGLSGDECWQAPISGGPNGRTFSLGFGGGGKLSAGSGSGGSSPSTNKGVGRGSGAGSSSVTGGGGGGAGCTCVAKDGALTIKICSTGNSLKCSSDKQVVAVVCGGRGPYTWSRTGSLILQGATGAAGSTASGNRITVRPPTNSGAAVGGSAYEIVCWTCNGANCTGSTCTSSTFAFRTPYNCDDSWAGAASCSQIGDTCTATTDPGASAVSKCCSAGNNQCSNLTCIDLRAGGCTGVTSQCDLRTAQMITDGCNPCGLQSGSTVTVTDSLGATAVAIMRA